MSEEFLHQHKIVPAPEFPTHLRQSRGMGVAKRRVKGDTGGVFPGNACEKGMHPVGAGVIFQRGHQCTAQAPALRFRVEVDGMLHRMGISRPAPELEIGGKAQDFARPLSHPVGLGLDPGRQGCGVFLGGGEGRSKGGRTPASASGTKSKGGRTRRRGKWTDARILRRRKSKRYGQLKL